MSSLLEQAIIDATALKEAALKNAESAVLEKYAPEVKTAVESLLEQEVDPMADPMAMGAPPADMGMETDVDAPLAATDGEEMCPCPDDGEEQEIEVNFAELEKMISGDQEPAEDQQDLAAAIPVQEEIELSEDVLDALLSEVGNDCTAENDDGQEQEELEESDASDENLEESLEDIIEKMVVDMASRKTGWLGAAEGEIAHEAELELARRQSTEFKEENAALKKAVADLQEKLTKYEATFSQVKTKLEETNLTNARLLYANRILNSSSLNERQKNKIVEAISKAGSVKEAKVIYETLQDTVGSAPDRRGPQSLREAVTRPSSIMSLRENRNRQNSDPQAERMQILAGIKK